MKVGRLISSNHTPFMFSKKIVVDTHFRLYIGLKSRYYYFLYHPPFLACSDYRELSKWSPNLRAFTNSW